MPTPFSCKICIVRRLGGRQAGIMRARPFYYNHVTPATVESDCVRSLKPDSDVLVCSKTISEDWRGKIDGLHAAGVSS